MPVIEQFKPEQPTSRKNQQPKNPVRMEYVFIAGFCFGVVTIITLLSVTNIL